METQAYFTNIRAHIATELKNANQSIYAAVAWITDQKLFTILCEKASKGLDVQLLLANDQGNITQTYGVDYQQLVLCGGKVYLIDEFATGILMHNKFCVIDRNTTISGSYNWSTKAQSNYENITIIRDSEDLAVSFIDEFRRIKVQHHGADPLKRFDAAIICKRLLIIDNLIQLEEYDQISLHLSKICEHELTNEVTRITEVIEIAEYENASTIIREYLLRVKSVSVFNDVEMERLKWELKYLEIEIVSLETEKSSILKIISDFAHAYNVAFGEILLKILRIKKEKLESVGLGEKSKRYKEAEEAYRQQEQEFAKAKSEKHYDLSPEEKEELKKKYRKACTLCHPDKFTDEESKTKAHKVFVELQNAYEKNDLKRVSEILVNLEKGNFDISPGNITNNRQELIDRVAYLRNKLKELQTDLAKLRNDKTYRDVVAIKNMQTFFEEERERLEKELNSLKNEQP